MTDVNDIKAGKYELIVLRWDQITSDPGKPLDFVRHRQGDVIDLNVEDAKRLWAAGAIRKPGEGDSQSFQTGPSMAPGGGSTPPPPPADPPSGGGSAGTGAGTGAGSGTGGTPPPEPTEEERITAVLANPTAESVKDVLDALAKRGNDATTAATVLELEKGGQSRPTLVKKLEELTAGTGDA